MGLSIANTMSPFMGRGAPMTVIKGGFALGLTRNTNASWYDLYFAPSIRLSGLATSSTGFFYRVLGRETVLGGYVSDIGLTEITAPDTVRAGRDYGGFVRIAHTPDLCFDGGSSAEGMAAAEEAARSARGDLGKVIAPDVRIVLHGKLDSLSVDNIVSAGVAGSKIATGSWFDKYVNEWPDGTAHNGWYASEVHIFDNPQLRGHVSAGSAKLFWDC